MRNLKIWNAAVAAGLISSGGLLVFGAARPAGAQTRTSITSLFSTGVTGTGTSLAASAQDIHYNLVSDPTGGSSMASPSSLFVTAADGFPIGPWMNYSAGNGASRWIEPVSGTTDNHASGTYLFRTTFDLTGFQASSAQLSLRVAMDNDLTEVRINGVAISSSSATGYASFTTLPAITSANATFVSGTNTIDFVVVNGPQTTGNPTGLRVEASGTAITGAAAPEPGTLALLLPGLMVMGSGSQCLLRRRRKSQTQ